MAETQRCDHPEKDETSFESFLSETEAGELSFAKSIVTVDGVEPSPEAERILALYVRGEIDYEMAQFEIERLYRER